MAAARELAVLAAAALAPVGDAAGRGLAGLEVAGQAAEQLAAGPADAELVAEQAVCVVGIAPVGHAAAVLVAAAPVAWALEAESASAAVAAVHQQTREALRPGPAGAVSEESRSVAVDEQ